MKPCVHRGELLTRGCGCTGQKKPEDRIYRCWEGGEPSQCIPEVQVLSPEVLTSAGYKLCDSCDSIQALPTQGVQSHAIPDNMRSGVSWEYVRQMRAARGSGVACPWEGTTNVYSPLPYPYRLPDVSELSTALVTPLAIYRVDTANCQPDLHNFNGGMLMWRGQRVAIYRHRWDGATLRTCAIDGNFVAHNDKPIHTAITPYNSSASEDPRPFVYRGQPCVSFTGVSRVDGRLAVSMFYAMLNPATFQVTAMYALDYPGRRVWEKNWVFFESGGQLYCVYDIWETHKILKVDGFHADNFAETPTPPDIMKAGLPRGGAAPVLVDDEWWCFTHGVVRINGRKFYSMGLYCFENKPPFAITRYVPGALLWPDEADRWNNSHPGVIFAGGAVKRGSVWEVMYGYQDRWMEVALFDHKALEASLVSA